MNKIIRFALIMVIALNSTSAFSTTSDDKEVTPVSAPAKEGKLSKDEIKALKLRLKEIRDIDKNQLTPERKQELRKEVLTIKEELKKSGSVIVISTTLLIVIILLIILL